MAIPDDVQAALTRLSGGYNNGDYNASTNPLGFSNGGHRINLYALTADFVLVGTWYEGLSEPINGITTEIAALGAIVADITTLAAVDDSVTTLAAIHTAVSTAAGIAANITTVAGIAANVTTVAGVAAAVTTTAGIADDVSAVAAIDGDVTQVSTIHGDVTQVSTIHTDVSNVSTIKDDVTAVSDIKDDVSQVSTIHAAVTTAASDSADIATVASDSADIRVLADLQDGTVATGALADLAGIKDDITAAVGNAADISAVADDLTNINTVAGSIVNVNKVAAVDADVSTVAAMDGNVGIVAGIAEDVTATAAIATAVTGVAADVANIDAVAADLTNINTVAGIAEDITDVAGIAANVTTVAANDANVTTVASNITDVATAAGVATEIATLAPVAADVTAVANIDTDVTAVAGVKDAITALAAVDSEITTLSPYAAAIGAVATIGGTDIATVADSAADIATAATNIVAIQGASGAASDAADARDAAQAYATTTKALTLHFSFNDATADADPGAGKIAFNDAAPTDVTVLLFSTSEANGGSVTGWLAQFDASTNLTDRGEITLVKDGAPGTWVKYKVVDATTTATGYRKIAVAYVAHAGTWADGDSFGISFARSGDAGADGEGAGNVNYVATTPSENELIAAGSLSNSIKGSGVTVSTDGTLAGNADTALPTQKAVKTYADTKLPASYLDTDGSLSANSDTKIATQKAVKAYADALIAANDAMVFKGATDCSSNPNYPAADRGHTYRVSVAGKIGGASGIVVEAGDLFICNTDSTASGNQATVGANWNVIQTNIDGAVVGPSSVTDGAPALFDGTSGKLLKQTTFSALKTSLSLVKGDVGLGNVDNTSDANKPVSTAQQAALDAKSDVTRSVNAQTGTTYTFVVGDAGKLCTFSNASAVTVTVPPNSSVAFPTNTQIDLAALGAGKVTFAQGSGVTINSLGGNKALSAQYAAGTLVKIGTDTWLLTGSLAA